MITRHRFSLNCRCKRQYNTIIDVGSIEHIFDTKQCLDNLFQILRVGGHIIFHLPCCVCFDHGFYAFSQEVTIESQRLCGFQILNRAFNMEPEGMRMQKQVDWNGCIIWCSACKAKKEKQFVIPHQNNCKAMYGIKPLKSVLEEFRTASYMPL